MLHHHNLEVTVEANIYDVTSQPRPSKPAPDATDMGILIETNSSPQKTSESHQPGGKKLFDLPTMNQYHPPPPPQQQPLQPTAASSPTSSADMHMAPPPPHPMYFSTLESTGGCGVEGGKTEPWSQLPPPCEAATEAGLPPLCAGCRLRIEDKFYLSAVDVKWHSACLKCAECGVELETQSSCFERDGHIYCKEDYRRIYNVNKCARCLHEIQPADLVMKARQFLFHVDCFRCDTCGLVLAKGDLFGMLGDHLYCQVHYEVASSDLIPTPLHVPTSNGPFTPDPMGHSPDGGQPFPGLHMPFPPPPSGVGGYPPPGPESVGWYPPTDFPPISGPGSGGPGDFQYDNNNEPMLKKRRGRKKRKVETFAAMNGYLEASGYPPGMDGQGGPGKTKRARTSFKHHQLRIMKHHFQINQNPDSRELKILSQKTQLDKKVLQVWFQNARAKWRRTRAQEPGGPSSHTNPSATSTSIGGGNPDDSSELGLGSPSSDCSGSMIPCC